MQRAEELFVNGISALLLSLLVWKMTENFTGWMVLAVPGAIMVVAGWIAALRN
jgi:hypothetical protein